MVASHEVLTKLTLEICLFGCAALPGNLPRFDHGIDLQVKDGVGSFPTRGKHSARNGN